MLEEQAARQLCQQVLQRCKAVPAEVVLLADESALTRFANNAIHQNVAEHNLTLYLRVLPGYRSGTASTNRTDPAALDGLVRRALAIAQASPEDPTRPGLAEPAAYTPVACFDEATAMLTPQWRAEAVGEVCRPARGKDLYASGAFASGAYAVAVANSLGLFAYHAYTEVDFQTVVMGADSSGRAQASSWKAADLSVTSLGQEAIWKAENGRNPQSIEPGEYTVVFDPYVSEDLLHMLNFSGMGGLAYQDGRSWMNDRLGQPAMSPLISIWDDGLDRNGLPLPFDFEGVPKQRVEIVSQGVVKGPVYDRTTAQKAGLSSTGHALPPNLPAWGRSLGPIALNLFMASGTSSVEEMIRSTERGLYITRFWYTRLVHPRDCVVTGMTRDGVFLIEKGELAYPVKNLRFTQAYVQALAEVEAVGQERRLQKTEYGSRAICTPALKISRFNFTGATV
jgi:predicted Zn-dependent protease